MVADKQTAELIDFIYRDATRVASLSAQLFGGHLVSTEHTHGGKEGSEKSGGVSAVFSGGYRAQNESNRSERRTLQPHDVVAVDLLVKLISEGRIHGSQGTAPPSAILRAVGKLTLVDRNILSMASRVFAANPDTAFLATLLGIVEMPAAFILETTTGPVVGTLDEAGLHEPITATYFKHGSSALDSVEVIGIRETATQISSSSDGESDFTKGVMQYANAVGDLLFPKSSIRVAPIAIFRKLS